VNATNRVLNRIVLLLVGIVLAAAGAIEILLAARPAWAMPALDAAGRGARAALAHVLSWTVAGPDGRDIAVATVLAFVVGAVLLVLLIVFLATRGGGRTSTVLRVDEERGDTAVDRTVADAVLTAPLRDRPDVLSAHTSVYRVRRAPAIRFAVTPRQGASLPRVIRAVDQAVADWDALAGTEIPVVLHLQGRGWLDRWRSATRVR
jgi:hypothetical protein